MISASYDFEHFADSVKGEDYYDIICLAEKEAIEAWRQCRKNGSSDGKCATYQSKLKGLIHFMRYGVKPTNLRNRDAKLYNLIYPATDQKTASKL